MPGKKPSPTLYSVHPGVAMMQKWVAELPEKTGRSLAEWIKLVRQAGPPTEKERRDWLKTNHGLGTNTAWWIAERTEGKGLEDGDPAAYLKAAEGYVEAMFAGAKAGLRPIYDRLLKIALGLGKDVKACPCKSIVPLYRNHVFAQLKPTTRTRLDLGLALRGTPAKGRLIDTGGEAKNDRITHRIPISSVGEIDSDLLRWLRLAYDRDA
jgi:hypothetical protein